MIGCYIFRLITTMKLIVRFIQNDNFNHFSYLLSLRSLFSIYWFRTDRVSTTGLWLVPVTITIGGCPVRSRDSCHNNVVTAGSNNPKVEPETELRTTNTGTVKT